MRVMCNALHFALSQHNIFITALSHRTVTPWNNGKDRANDTHFIGNRESQ